jgi:NAD(P)-dependent dehydrogenase (short-subunit alcohol dehydrogenase family)
VGALDGQVALVTGASRFRGMGRAIALLLASNGADVAVTDLMPGGTRNDLEPTESDEQHGWAGIDSVVAEIQAMGRRSLALYGDVGLKEDAEAMVDEAIAKLGQVDILVNNAAAPHGPDRGWTWELPESAFDDAVHVNTKGPFLMSSAVVRHLLAREAPGRIINISSTAGRRGFLHRSVYSASKFGVIGLTQCMAQELGRHRITVNAVCPGAINTPRLAASTALAIQASGGVPEEWPSNPIARQGEPGDIARVVAFLADPASDFITGQSINVDGGAVMS